MSKKLILFLMLALFGSTAVLRADEITIGSGTSTNNALPSRSYFRYSLSQQLYTADEIGTAGTINSIAFYNAGTEVTRTLDLYMLNTEKTAFTSNTDWITVAATDLVFSGSVTMTTNVWTTITLDTPFEYDGTSNLAVIVDDNTGSYVNGAEYYVFTTTSAEAIFVYSDGTNYDPFNPTFNATSYQIGVKNQIVLDIEASSTPTGELTITPEQFVLGERPTNAWMESFDAVIYNGADETSVTVSLSNTTGVNPFALSQTINNVTLATGESIEFTVDVNNVADGDYAEELTLFYTERGIITLPVTATLYTAGEADVVETAKNLNASSFSETPTGMHANYKLSGMSEMTTDAVYTFTLAKDSYFNVESDGVIAIYNYVADFQPTAEVEPLVMTTDGLIIDQILLAGTYYMIVADENLTSVEGYAGEIPAPTAVTYLAPENYATGIEAPVTLTWEGGINAAEYQVLFGTSATNMSVALDWTIVDENYGSYVVNDITPNTLYFWQVNVRNSNGTITGPRWGFTSSLIAPHAVTVSEDQIFTDGSTLVKWKLAGVGGFEGEVTVCEGTETNSYVPVYGLWMDYYTRSEMIYPAEMLEEMEGGEITSIKYYISTAAAGSWAPATFNVYMMEVDATTLSSYYGPTNATIVYSGALDGTGTEMTITLDTPYEYEGGNLLVGIEQTVLGTYRSCYFYGVTATGASASGYNSVAVANAAFNQRNFLPKTTFVCGDAKGNRALNGYNVYYGTVKANTELITDKQYTLSNLPYNMDGHDINVTAVYQEGESGHSTPVVEVQVSGYGTFTGTVTELMSGDPVADVTVTFNGKDEFNNAVSFEGTTNANGVYSFEAKAGTYVGVTSIEGMEPNYSESVTLEYEGTTTVDFVIHEVYKPVGTVIAEDMTTLANIRWALGESAGGGSEFFEGFENGGIPSDWTVIDANSDGWTWTATSNIPNVWTYYASLAPLDWYRTGSDAVCSGSYINGVSALTPDEYLVTPQVTIVNGSTFSFWAAAIDSNYPADHFGVAVSDNGTSDWTMVDEWTLTAKAGANGGRESRDGNGAKIGTWYNYSVDLSSYTGKKYIAIRHFNCNDQYIMCVDDVELTVGSKGNRAVEYYTVYRKAILKENGVTAADSVLLANNLTDTNYADYGWNNVEPGLYQYGVSAVYPGAGRGNNRDEVVIGDGTSTTYVTPFNSLWGYSYVQQIYTAEEIGTAGTINSIAFNLSSGSSTNDIEIFMVNTEQETFASTDNFVPVTAGDKVFDGNVTFNAGWTTITLDSPFYYDGTSNLMIGIHEYTSGYSTQYFYYTSKENSVVSFHSDGVNPDPANMGSYSGSKYVSPNRANITIDITAGGGGGGNTTNDDPVTPICWSNVLPKNMDATVVVNATASTGSVEGAVVTFTNLNEDIEYVEELDETGALTIEGFRKGEYTLTVELDGFISNYNATEVSIWEDMEFNAYFTENFLPVDEMTVSGTGFARWTDMLPGEERAAERYQVMLNNIYQGETTNNYMQLDVEGLTVGETYTAKVAVVYTTGMSAWKEATFTLVDCSTVSQQVEDLEGVANCMDVVLTWNGGTPTPPVPPTPPTGDVTVILTAGDVWGDGSGYQMLLDNTHSLYGTTIPTTGALSLSCSGNEAIYAQFSHKIPENADGNCSTQNIVLNNSVSITIPAGTYDWCITNPTPGDRIWIASSQGNVGGRYDDYVFEAGHTYEFTVYMLGTNDATDVTITGGKGMYQPNMAIMSQDVKTTGMNLSNELASSGYGFGQIDYDRDGNWYYYDSGTNYSAIGLSAGGSFYWGIMFPAGSFEGNKLSKISYFDSEAHSGQVLISQGGTSAPGTLLYTQAYTTTGSSSVIEINMDAPVTVDNTQNLWVVMHNTNGQYVATYDGAAGQTNGSWLSTDGSTWYASLNQATGGSYDGNWNIRAYIEEGGGSSSIKPNKFNIFMDGEFIGATSDNSFTYEAEDTNAHTYEVFFVDANYNFSCAAEVTVTAGTVPSVTDLTYELNDPEVVLSWNGTAQKYVIYRGLVSGGQVNLQAVGETTSMTFTDELPGVAGAYLYVVQSVSGECSSDLQEEIDNENYVIVDYDMTGENEVVNKIYPNPTSGDLYINATAMRQITVYNAMGQMVYNQDVNADEMVIDMSQLESGVYMVNIVTENGSSVKRVTVVK